MLQYAVREHLVKAAVTERQVTAISHHVDGGDTKLARNPLCRAYAFQRRIDTHWPISGASCRHTPSAPTATDLQERSPISRRQPQTWNRIFHEAANEVAVHVAIRCRNPVLHEWINLASNDVQIAHLRSIASFGNLKGPKALGVSLPFFLH